jgi:hypothetical protein
MQLRLNKAFYNLTLELYPVFKHHAIKAYDKKKQKSMYSSPET